MATMVTKETTNEGAGEKISVLVVEDDEFFASLVTKKLGTADCIVSYAETGEKALEMLKSEKPDIIVLDILLPGIDGIEVLRQIKENNELKMIPVIFLSNFGSKEQIDAGKKLGVYKHIIKATVTLNEVVQEIKEAVQGK